MNYAPFIYNKYKNLLKQPNCVACIKAKCTDNFNSRVKRSDTRFQSYRRKDRPMNNIDVKRPI